MPAEPAKLKRCPFCGGHAERRSILEWGVDEDGYEYEANRYYVACSNCGIKTERYADENYPVDLWNRRIDGKEVSA